MVQTQWTGRAILSGSSFLFWFEGGETMHPPITSWEITPGEEVVMRKNHTARIGHGVASGGVVALFAGLFLIILCTANTVPAQLSGEGEFIERCRFSVALDGDIARVGRLWVDLSGVSADVFNRHAVTG
jgi:hypothetical protein